MIQHVYERVKAVKRIDQVLVATDSQEVADTVVGFGGFAVMTRTDHICGTERVAEAASFVDTDLILNVQADEPLISHLQLDPLIDIAQSEQFEIGTLVTPVETLEDFRNPNVVKVVLNALGEAMYFSRAPIPWHRDHLTEHALTRAPGAQFYRHIGIYAYHAGYITGYAAAEPTGLECAEALEQLRALYTGARIHVELALEPPGPGVDTPADLELARALVADMSASGS